MKKKNNHLQSIKNFFMWQNSLGLYEFFFLLNAIEAAAVFIYIFHIPADPKNSLIFGLSSQRILLLAGVFGYFLISIVLFYLARSHTEMYFFIGQNIGKPRILVINLFICIFTIWVLLLPDTGLRGQYPHIFEKLDPIILLIALFTFQAVCLIALLQINSIPLEKRKPLVFDLFKRYAIPLIVFFFPFLFFFPRTIPINGEFFGIANDFIPTSYTYKVYLLDCLSHFHLPLWSPSEAAGFPFFSNPFSQFFYPLNIPQTILYSLNGGYSILDHQRYSVLGISIFALGLFYWLKEFPLSHKSVFFVSLIIPVSFRLAELIRYPSGLHSAAWYPWILLAITKVSLSTSKRNCYAFSLLFIFSCFSLVTGGYQYYLYYSLFLFIPYLIIIFIPATRLWFFPNSPKINTKNIGVLILASFVTLLITSPYIVHMAKLLSLITARGGESFSFSTAQNFTLIDTLGSLVYPPSSQTEGWYYFGLANLILILFYLLPLQVFNQSLLGITHHGDSEKLLPGRNPSKYLLIFWIVVISYISYGSESYLFIFLWKYLPYFSHMRFLGRINIVLIPIIGLLLAYSFDYFRALSRTIFVIAEGRKKQIIHISIFFFLIYICLLAIQIYLISTKTTDPYWNKFFYIQSDNKTYFVITGIAVILLFQSWWFIIHNPLINYRKATFLWTTLFVALTLADLWHVGAYMWWNGTISTKEDQRVVLDVQNRIIKESLAFKREDTFLPPSVMLSPISNVSFGYDWYFESYKAFYQRHNFEPNERKILLGVQTGERLFFSKSISHKSIADFLDDSRTNSFEYEVEKFTGDTLLLKATVYEEGYLSYIDNWDKDWKAYVNGKPVPIEKLFSTFKSIKLEPGEWIIQFSYEPSLIPFDKSTILDLVN